MFIEHIRLKTVPHVFFFFLSMRSPSAWRSTKAVALVNPPVQLKDSPAGERLSAEWNAIGVIKDGRVFETAVQWIRKEGRERAKEGILNSLALICLTTYSTVLASLFSRDDSWRGATHSTIFYCCDSATTNCYGETHQKSSVMCFEIKEENTSRSFQYLAVPKSFRFARNERGRWDRIIQVILNWKKSFAPLLRTRTDGRNWKIYDNTRVRWAVISSSPGITCT